VNSHVLNLLGSTHWIRGSNPFGRANLKHVPTLLSGGLTALVLGFVKAKLAG
jgi:hypothetical protein